MSRKLRSDIDIFTDFAQLTIERGGFKKVESELFKRLRKSIHTPLLMALTPSFLKLYVNLLFSFEGTVVGIILTGPVAF